ncbi:MAG: acyltransferase domain-containing protein [Deltaproteobacteria bacterium]|nr:acyltransferase domain-containing protein [Deltaproteobacteria bacterium]
MKKTMMKKMGSKKVVRNLPADGPFGCKNGRKAQFDAIAVVGMAGRFPGANDISTLWDNICNKVESITWFSKEELDKGIGENILKHPAYVPARGIVEDADKFDANFFSISPLEAKTMDPQQRIMLELAWSALENAGHDPGRFDGDIGMFAGVGDNQYYFRNVMCHQNLVDNLGTVIIGLGNEKDYAASRVAYHLDLHGPAVSSSMQCSTSLLAVDLAFKSLNLGECDMALAGGVDIFVPQKSGQIYREGGTFTKDGHCRPFDAEATGTMFCDGAGVVVLRRLENAIADGDTIYAMVRGCAKNNDGSRKVSFFAPSVEGQCSVIRRAQEQADVHPEEIGYHEAHGTGTPLGDPIEIEALTKAFREKTSKTGYCHISSIKGNIGHPTIASGIAGFIKVALSLHHEKIPPIMHFNKPNPKIDFENTPFVVAKDLVKWPRSKNTRIASVSAFGFGGTNVHAILEEGPIPKATGPSRPVQLLRISGKSSDALKRNCETMSAFFKNNTEVNLADAAYTLDLGRAHHDFRDFVVCDSAPMAAENLSKTRGGSRSIPLKNSKVVFMFPGQGVQYVNMGKSLYQQEAVFRKAMNECFAAFKPHMKKNLKRIIFPDAGNEDNASELLKNTTYTQPAIFSLEYSLAQLWIYYGVTPAVMVGHSIGEFVCATLSGVFTLADACAIVALRGRLMGGLPRGSMLSVRSAAKDIEARLPVGIQLAASNSPGLCVVAGPDELVEDFANALEIDGIKSTKLHTSHAFHSEMMAPIVETFAAAVNKIKRHSPGLPFISTCSGDWITEQEAVSAEYWATHLIMPVRFSEAIAQLAQKPDHVFLEVGPRNVLTILTRQRMEASQSKRVIPTLGDTHADNVEWTTFLSAVGDLWCNGVAADSGRFYENEIRRRIPLPTYSFERKRFWLDPVSVHYQDFQFTDAVNQDEDTEFRKSTNTLTAEESYLLSLWIDVLGIDNLTIDDNFFDVGGHSLIGMTMLDKINSKFCAEFVLSDMIHKPTIRQFSNEVVRRGFGISPSTTDGLQRDVKSRSGGQGTHITSDQQYLLTLWQEVLGVNELTIDDNFFDLGGHSLIGISMLDRINIRCGSHFILSDIIRKPTIRQFSEEIVDFIVDVEPGKSPNEHKAKDWTPLVALSPKGSRTPVYCVAGHGGHVMELHTLATQFASADIPFFGLETRGVAGHKPFETIEEIAEDHIAAIRHNQPRGPYYIAGYSFGGAIAFEMAQRLTAVGETIAWLGLLDAQSPTLPFRSKLDFRRVQLKRLIHDPGEYFRGMMMRRFMQPPVEKHFAAVTAATDKAVAKYNPVPYRGDAFLFRVPKDELLYGENYAYIIDEFEGWRELIRGVLHVIPVRGGHVTVISDATNAKYLATRMISTIEKIYYKNCNSYQ